MLTWEAIKFASIAKKIFDFEGSMNENIEKFFRGFNTVQKSYFSITKTNSKLIKAKRLLREILRYSKGTNPDCCWNEIKIFTERY